MRKIHLEKRQQPKQNPNTHLALSEENFKIYLRVKPILNHNSTSQSLRILNHQKIQVIPPTYSPISDAEKVYQYEEVFDGGRSNKQIFDKAMITPITNALGGFNSTVFIYGMTGAGKTYTMFGNGQAGNFAEEGLVSMSIDYMFDQIYQQKNIKSQVNLSFFQIYNENIRDLLQESSQNLTIMEDPLRGVIVNELMELQVQQIEQTKEIIGKAVQRRAMNATKSNQISSRSHAILQFIIRRFKQTQNDEISVSQSKFFMIDLAGNEKTSQNEAKRFVEGVNINKSLLTLGKCFNILSQKKNSYVPFRESKLTRILKQSLGGNSKTVMVACVSSERKFYEETLNTLKYSSVAKKIKNKGIKTNSKLVSKRQLPGQKQYIHSHQSFQSEEQRKITSLMGQFLQLMNEKFKIQATQENLQYSRNENEKILLAEDAQIQICTRNINKINEVSSKLNEVYDSTLGKADIVYKGMMEQIFSISKKKNQSRNLQNQRMEIIRLNEVIQQQKARIKQLEEKVDPALSEHCNSISQIESVRKSENIGNVSQQKQNKRLSNNEETFRGNKNFNPYKNLKIDVSLGDQSNRSKIEQENHNNSFSQLSLQKRKSEDRRNINKLQKQIVINLNSFQNGTSEKSQGRNTEKEEFLKKLKETEKRAKGVSQNQISELLEEQESKQYELGNVEMSMLRKLRFFQREKSLQKSNSLGGMSLRNPSVRKGSKF